METPAPPPPPPPPPPPRTCAQRRAPRGAGVECGAPASRCQLPWPARGSTCRWVGGWEHFCHGLHEDGEASVKAEQGNQAMHRQRDACALLLHGCAALTAAHSMRFSGSRSWRGRKWEKEMMGGRTPPAAAVASSMRCRQVGMCAGRLEGRQDSRACWEAGWRLEVWLWFRLRLCSRACLQRRAEPGFLVQRVKVAGQRVVLVAELRLGAPAADVEVQHDLWQGGAGDTHRAERQREPAWGTHMRAHIAAVPFGWACCRARRAPCPRWRGTS